MAGMPELRRRTHSRSNPSGNDDTAYYPQDDNHGFFAKGRDFESAFVNHRYTSEEKRTLASYESLDYLPPHSQAYTNWIRKQPPRLDWDRWIMMGMIGFTVGFIGFLLHQITELIADFKWEQAKGYIEENDLVSAWGFVLGYSVLFVLIASLPVVFFRPSAAGSGIPEVIGFLNGTIVRNIFNVKTMVVKFFSCCAAVGSGMPVGPEGPMIHLGSLVGAGLSQFSSQTLHIKLPFFERFRNSEDRRNFISAGAAAGVASAFGAPVGGLLFSMEEVSSFWNMKLSWQIFFCAMVSTFTTDLFNSAFTGFRYQGQFGMFKADKYILFQVSTAISVNLLAFIPAVILGVVGGILGALFTFTNLKIARGRKRLLAGIGNSVRCKLVKLTEPVIIMILVASVSVFLPAAFPCDTVYCLSGTDKTLVSHCFNDTEYALHTEPTVERYTCPDGDFVQNGTRTLTNLTYNQMATLLFDTGEDAIHHLFSRNTHLEFGYLSLITALVFYFVMACWAAGTAISSGIVVPMLFIGGLYGRMLGRGMVDLFGVHVGQDSYWSWMDPGAFALVGAASFFGGVSRLTMSLTVIMMEITNDVQFLLPIMATIMVAKWVGDFLTHPLYHALLELKCIPFLDAEPVITNEAREMVNLELFRASDVMSSSLHTCQVHESVHNLAELLCTYSHGGFPVLKQGQANTSNFYGFISRQELLVLLQMEDLFQSEDDLTSEGADEVSQVTPVDFHQVSVDKPHNAVEMVAALSSFMEDEKYRQLYINLEPYVNQSAVSIPAKFSLHRTYIIFRTLGLRHLTVVDENNKAVGVITRKDLMGFSMEERLASKLRAESLSQVQNVELADVNAII